MWRQLSKANNTFLHYVLCAATMSSVFITLVHIFTEIRVYTLYELLELPLIFPPPRIKCNI